MTWVCMVWVAQYKNALRDQAQLETHLLWFCLDNDIHTYIGNKINHSIPFKNTQKISWYMSLTSLRQIKKSAEEKMSALTTYSVLKGKPNNSYHF
jgi:hypothetical protein